MNRPLAKSEAYKSEANKSEAKKLEANEPQHARPAIRIRDLNRRFGELIAVDGVSVEIAHGEFFVIVGPSGCGKTTLLRILAGLDSVTSGTIEIETPNSQRPVNSMIFKGDSIFPWMTVWDNAAYGKIESPWKIIEFTGRWEFGVSISIVPEVTESSPARMRNSVVLPQPLGPTITKNSP